MPFSLLLLNFLLFIVRDVKVSAFSEYLVSVTFVAYWRIVYRHTLRWIDSTPCYHCNASLQTQIFNYVSYHTTYSIVNPLVFRLVRNEKIKYFPAHELYCYAHICEEQKQDLRLRKHITLSTKTAMKRSRNITSILLMCRQGHLTYNFLSCGSLNVCGLEEIVYSCRETESSSAVKQMTRTKLMPVTMFECREVTETISFTLLCDFIRHCSDGSDEDFCTHPNQLALFRYYSFFNMHIRYYSYLPNT